MLLKYADVLLTVLGSGTSVPHAARSSSGYWLQTSSGSVLLDFSAAAVYRLEAEGLDWPNLGAIWISHFHLDHCGGLAPFLFGIKHAGRMKQRIAPLRIVGPPGTKRILNAFDAVNNYRLFEQRFPVEIVETEEHEKFEMLPGLEAVTAKTVHTDESRALRLRDSDGTTMVYTSDTAFSDEIAVLATGVDLLLMECSFFREQVR